MNRSITIPPKATPSQRKALARILAIDTIKHVELLGSGKVCLATMYERHGAAIGPYIYTIGKRGKVTGGRR